MRIANTHTVRFWSYVEGIGPYATVERTWTAGPVVSADVQHRQQAQADPGPGVTGQGTWKVYAHPVDVVPQMVVEVVTGPNAPQKLAIEDAYNVRGHHVQLTCSAWKGDLNGGS